MVSSKVTPVMQKPSGFLLNSGTLPKMTLSHSGKKFVARTSELGDRGTEKNVSLNNVTVSDEPVKKRVRLGVMLKSQTDSDGSIPSSTSSKQMSSDTVSVDSGIDVPNVEFKKSSRHKKINVIDLNSRSVVENSKAETLRDPLSLGNTNISLSGIINLEGSDKRVKCPQVVSTEKDAKSVYDIIVQHNIALQTRKSKPKQILRRGVVDNGKGSAPMVFFPCSDLFTIPRNTNTQQTSAKITKGLMHRAYEDWVRCSIPDENGNIPLHKAVINENITLVKRQCVVLCARKSKLDIYNYDKETPLQLAVLNGNAEISQMLLYFGAQPSVKDNNGNTALHLAVLHGNLECVKVILNTNNTKSLPLNDFNDEGYSPMHLSVLNGKVEETKCLISRGAEVNLKDAKSGRTPLFHAVEANDCDLVQLLLACDANPYEANFSGHTPLTAAGEVSFSCRNTTKEYSFSEGISFSSKLVPLSRGSDVARTLDEGNNIVFGAEFEDVHMDEVRDSDSASRHCDSSAADNNSDNPWFLND